MTPPVSLHHSLRMAELKPSLLAVHPNSFGRYGVEGAILTLGELGVRYLELPIKSSGVPSFFGEQPVLTESSGPADVARVHRVLGAAGIAVCSANVTSGNPLQESVLNITLRKLRLAAELGVTLAIGGAGEAADEAERVLLLRNLAAIGDEAARLGMVYCFETHPGLCRNAAAMLDTMQALQHDHLRLNFDTGNILYYNAGANVGEPLQQVAPFVRHVHLKDTNGKPGEWHFPALGAGGAVDFGAVRRILCDCGFGGPFSLEIEGIAGEPPPELDLYRRRIADSLAHLRQCGYFGES